MVFDGPMSVVAVMNRLGVNREAVLVIRNGTLVPGDAMLDRDDEIEIRPVISGGCAEPPSHQPNPDPGGSARVLARSMMPVGAGLSQEGGGL